MFRRGKDVTGVENKSVTNYLLSFEIVCKRLKTDSVLYYRNIIKQKKPAIFWITGSDFSFDSG